MEEALKVWSDVADLEFERVENGVAHIDIQFGKGEHGDDDPFDGRGGTLAHAFFPLFGGDIHFDSEERWTVKTSRGVSLAQSAAHEIGHSLGEKYLHLSFQSWNLQSKADNYLVTELQG